MDEHCIKLNVIPDTSFGFKKGSSTIDCLLMVVDCIKNAIRDGFIVAGALCDCTKAFDFVDPEILIGKMYEKGFDRNIIHWLYNFLINKKMIEKTAEELSEVITSFGLLQGDPTSPSLFNMYTCQLHDIANNYTFIFQYADDFFIIVTAKKKTELYQRLNQKVNEFAAALSAIKVQLNPHKTKILFF